MNPTSYIKIFWFFVGFIEIQYKKWQIFRFFGKFGANCIKVKYNLDRSLPISKILKYTNKKTRLVILANPNSPYGDYKRKNEINELASNLKEKNIILLVDEAYVEFSPGSMVKLIKTHNNLLISRTFSKAWGAAGCRVGYIIGNKKIVDLLGAIVKHIV